MSFEYKTFYKVVREDLTHNEVVYKLGLNIDPLKFNPKGSCQSGGLYFTDIENIGKYFDYGNLVAYITIPNDALIYKDPEGDKWKADRFIIDRFEPFESFWCKPEVYSSNIKHCYLILQYMKEQTHDICLKAVRIYGGALQFVKEKTHYICL